MAANKALAGGGAAGTATVIGGAVATLVLAKWYPGSDANTGAALATVFSFVLAVPVAFVSVWLTKLEGGDVP